MTDPALWRSHMQEEGEPAATAYACVYPRPCRAFLCEPRRPFMPPIIIENDVTVRASGKIGFLSTRFIHSARKAALGGVVFAQVSLAQATPSRDLFFFFFFKECIFLRSAHFTRDWYRSIETRRGLCALPTCSFRGNNWISFCALSGIDRISASAEIWKTCCFVHVFQGRLAKKKKNFWSNCLRMLLSLLLTTSLLLSRQRMSQHSDSQNVRVMNSVRHATSLF